MSNIIDINQNQFIEQVVEKSKTIPVIVDFWAPWCGPCKQLTPILEKVVNDKNGKVILAKINIDENQEIAGQLNVKSIPTVYGFVEGKPIDAFQGAQPESKIIEMVNKLIDATPGNEIPKLIEEANEFFKSQKFQESFSIYQNLLSLDPGNPIIITGMMRCLIQLRKIEDAIEILESLNDELLQNEEILKIKKIINDMQKSNDGISIDSLKEALETNPSDKDIRLKLAEKYFALNESENGFKELLFLFSEDPKWNEELAKKKLLEQFDLLGFNDPNVVEARKKLSSLMFK